MATPKKPSKPSKPATSTAAKAPAMPPLPPKPAEDASAIDPVRAATEFDTVRSKLVALGSASLRPLSVDATAGALNALALHENLRTERERITRELPSFDLAHLDQLPTLAYAFWHTGLLTDTEESALVAELLPRATALKSALVGVTQALIARSRVAATALDDVTPGSGFADLASDLGKLATRIRVVWSSVQGRIDVTEAELAEAEALAAEILKRLALRLAFQKPGDLSASELRVRAFTLLSESVDACRQAAAWIFWKHPDGWESRAPSLHANQGGRGRSATKANPAKPLPPEGDPTPAGPPSP